MKTLLRVLIVEDNPDDAELLVRVLTRADFEPEWSRVETEAAFLEALQKRPDTILSDYSMPGFSGLRALELLRASGLDIPFILISGTVGEDVAVKAMRDGAADYLLKDRVARLPGAVTSALRQTRLRTERNKAEEDLRRNVEMLHHAGLERDALIASLKSALSEKTVLLKEVHHRVKNNMAVMIGLLGMQAETLDNEPARTALSESQHRVSSMALVHENLYATEQADRVNFGDYVRQLAGDLMAAYCVPEHGFHIETEMEKIDLPVDRAIPCGLILNELISKALQVACREDHKGGAITIRFRSLGSGQLLLSCRENDAAIADRCEWGNPQSLAARIVGILAKQINGALTFDSSGSGIGFELQFACDC